MARSTPWTLLARHNIPFRVLRPADLTTDILKNLVMLVVFAAPHQEQTQMLVDFASRGGVMVLVDLHGSYPWHSAQPIQKSEPAVTYAVGRGRIVELSEPVADPEIFAQDIRRLMA